MARRAESESVAERLAERAAFAAFYDEALPRIYGYFAHRCDPAVAEELTQETFLAAMAVLRSRKTIRAPVPWLFGIARNKLIDYYRRQNRSRRRAVISLDAWQDDGGPEPVVEEPLWQEDGWRARTATALATMPEAQRQVLVLRYLDQMSMPAMATALGRSPHAVESLLARGRVSFKRGYLEANGDDDE